MWFSGPIYETGSTGISSQGNHFLDRWSKVNISYDMIHYVYCVHICVCWIPWLYFKCYFRERVSLLRSNLTSHCTNYWIVLYCIVLPSFIHSFIHSSFPSFLLPSFLPSEENACHGWRPSQDSIAGYSDIRKWFPSDGWILWGCGATPSEVKWHYVKWMQCSSSRHCTSTSCTEIHCTVDISLWVPTALLSEHRVQDLYSTVN